MVSHRHIVPVALVLLTGLSIRASATDDVTTNPIPTTPVSSSSATTHPQPAAADSTSAGNTGDTSKQQATDSAPINVALGYVHNYGAKAAQTYYNITGLGPAITNGASAPTFAGYSSTGLADVSKYDYTLSVLNGSTSYGGSLLKGYNTSSLPQKIGIKGINLVLGVNTQLQSSSSTTWDLGLEQSHPISLSFRDKTIPICTGFLKFGFTDERQSQGSGATDQFGPTLRGLIGRPIYFGSKYRKNSDDLKYIANLAKFDDAFNQYAKDKDLKTKAADINGAFASLMDTITANYVKSDGKTDMPRRTQVIKAIVKYLQGNAGKPVSASVGQDYTVPAIPATPTTPEKPAVLLKVLAADVAELQSLWPAEYQQELRVVNREFVDKAPVTIWADANARWALGQHVGGPFRMVYSYNLKINLNPNDKKNAPFLQAQYVNGFEEATPTKRSNLFQVSLGFAFGK